MEDDYKRFCDCEDDSFINDWINTNMKQYLDLYGLTEEQQSKLTNYLPNKCDINNTL